jgi:hypothetical protein
MPHLTFPISQDGYALTVLIGLNGRGSTDLAQKGQPIPAPLSIRAVIDTGTDITCVAARVPQQLGLASAGEVQTQTIAGFVNSHCYDVSLSNPKSGSLTGPLLVLDDLRVMELLDAIPNVEALIGKDVLSHCLLIIDGKRGEFTLAD